MKKTKVLLSSIVFILLMASPAFSANPVINKVEWNPSQPNVKVTWSDPTSDIADLVEWSLWCYNSSNQYVGGYTIKTAYVGSPVINQIFSFTVPSNTSFIRISCNRLYYDSDDAEWYDLPGGTSANFSYPSGVVSPPPSIPSAPSDLTVHVDSQTQATLSWTDNSTNETGFRIYTQNDVLVKTVGSNIHEVVISGLTANTAYSYYVVAYNDAGESGKSALVNFTTLPNPPPNAPTDFIGVYNPITESITWSWTVNSQDEDGFYIYDSEGIQIGQVGKGVSIFTEEAGQDDTDFIRYVVAYSVSGLSGNSNQYTVHTPVLVPPDEENPPDDGGVDDSVYGRLDRLHHDIDMSNKFLSVIAFCNLFLLVWKVVGKYDKWS